MRVLVCPDSFKGTLSASRAAEIIAHAAERSAEDIEAIRLPLTDGGDGALEALAADGAGLEILEAEVTGPLGGRVLARWAKGEAGIAFIEMAEASGLSKLEGAANPLAASTYGTGELLLAALDADCREISIALGGSATNDGGMGFAAALGARFLDAGGEVLEPSGAALARVAEVDLSRLDPRLQECEITILADVDNPLLGPEGATFTFGAQKGATPEVLEALEAGMATYARAMAEATGRAVADAPGAGAAGGLGFACLSLADCTPTRGIDGVLDLLDFDGTLATVDLVVTGEGHADAQTLHGKVVAGVLERCQAAKVPCVAIVGAMDEDATALLDAGLAAIVPCVIEPGADAALANAARNLRLAAARTFSLIALGRALVLDK